MKNLHPIFQQALEPFAPRAAEARQIALDAAIEAEHQAVDAAMHADKLADGYAQRNYLAAMIKQTQGGPA